MRLGALAIPFLLVSGALGPPTIAQVGGGAGSAASTGAADPWALISPLDDPIYAVREQSEQMLIEGGAPSLPELHAMLASGRLSAEQHARVRRVARARFMTTPRAGMGVSFDRTAPGEARILELVPGFPAGELIEPGDEILVAAGVPLQNYGHLGVLILSHDPDESMPTTIRRGGAELELDVPLGDFSNLQQARPNIRALEDAYRVRARRDGAPARHSSGTLGEGLTLGDWTRAELGLEPPESLPPSSQIRRPAGAGRTTVVGGVTPDASVMASAATSAQLGTTASAWLLRRGELARRRLVLERQWERASADNEAGQAVQMRRRLDKYDAQLAELNRRLGAGDETGTP